MAALNPVPGLHTGSLSRIRLALLTNFVPPYRLPVFLELARRAATFRVVISTRMEANRNWDVNFGSLDVLVQRTFTVQRTWKHPSGFRETVYNHFSYDTIWELLRYRPDVTISAELGFRTLSALIYRLIARRSRLVIWATISESSEAKRDKARMILRSFLLRFTDAVMVNGRSGARYLARHGAKNDKIFIVPQTTSIEAFSAAPLERSPEAQRRLIYVGQLASRKGLIPFLEVLKRWCEDHADYALEFWFCGEGPERVAIEQFPRPANVALKLLGNAAYDDVPACYAQAGIMVMPTLADEWGLVVNEALASGLPVLGSLYSSAVEDLVEEGVNGWRFHIDQPEEVYAALSRCFSMPDEALNMMRRRARETALRISPDFVVDRMSEAVRFAIEGTR
jgi:hypothetical protein